MFLKTFSQKYTVTETLVTIPRHNPFCFTCLDVTRLCVFLVLVSDSLVVDFLDNVRLFDVQHCAGCSIPVLTALGLLPTWKQVCV